MTNFKVGDWVIIHRNSHHPRGKRETIVGKIRGRYKNDFIIIPVIQDGKECGNIPSLVSEEDMRKEAEKITEDSPLFKEIVTREI